MGSTTQPAIGILLVLMISSTALRHLSSSILLNSMLSLSWRGYYKVNKVKRYKEEERTRSLGKGAWGHLKAGMSTLWMALECVVEREPNNRPWKPPVNDNIANSGDPGVSLFMQELNSSSEIGLFCERMDKKLWDWMRGRWTCLLVAFPGSAWR